MENERRLIDANALKSEYEWLLSVVNPCSKAEIRDAIERIENAPTVDAVEVPPLKIGDTAYFVVQGKIYEAKIVLLQWCQRANRTDTEIRGEVVKTHSVSAAFSDWGKTVFATREEAEKLLYPCEYCFCGSYRSCEGCSYGERKDNG